MTYYEAAAKWWEAKIGRQQSASLFRHRLEEVIKKHVENEGRMELATEETEGIVFCIALATGINREMVPHSVKMEITKGGIKVRDGELAPMVTIFYARTE